MNILFKKIVSIVCAFLCLIHFNACDKKDTTELFWHITQCKDAWWVENVELTSLAYRELMDDYLKTENIIIEDHFLEQNAEASEASCTGCGCKTTFKIRTIFLDEDVEDAKALGFTEE